MLLAYVKDRELTWQPLRWLGAAVLVGCLIHSFLPGYTADRPRGMNFLYTEVEGDPHAYLAVENLDGRPDRAYVTGHDFTPTELNNGRFGTVSRPAREVPVLRLPGVSLSAAQVTVEDDSWRHRLAFAFPPQTRRIQFTVPESVDLKTVRINGVLAFDAAVGTERHRSQTLRLVYPPGGGAALDIVTATPEAFRLAVSTWRELPERLTGPFMGNWPDDARPFGPGPRAEKIQYFDLAAEP